jgi:hypothetical protein
VVAVTDLSNKRIVSFPKKGNQTEPSPAKKSFRSSTSTHKSKAGAPPVAVVEPEPDPEPQPPVRALVPLEPKPKLVSDAPVVDQLSLDDLMANARSDGESSPVSRHDDTVTLFGNQTPRVA